MYRKLRYGETDFAVQLLQWGVDTYPEDMSTREISVYVSATLC